MSELNQGGKKAPGQKTVSIRTGPVAIILLALIRFYQLTLSAFIGRHCRHLPTCSDYAMQAIRMHGAWAGFWLGFFRVMRCHPLGTHGFDPVPEEGVARFDPAFWRYARHGRCVRRAGASSCSREETKAEKE
ncbi:membrane protein insertion efficiency factor YidD [Thermopetrobacter sp. TC1]|uniref:membrane protein insertion efficiency factor YidD n=1 Tax=Thermopetrobacter sp. TC1 TaxID=1495045 RepID=UPI00068B3CE2